MSHVFISYSHKDEEIMQRIKTSLIHGGIKPWTDEGLDVGTSNWQTEIENAIANSMCLVCILTPSAKESLRVHEHLVHSVFYDKPVYMVYANGGSESKSISGLAISRVIDVNDDALYDARMQTLCNLVMLHTYDKTDTSETHNPTTVQFLRTAEVKSYTPVEAAINETPLTSIPPHENHQLVVIDGQEYTGRTLFELKTTLVTIGRSDKNTILVRDESVSREHLQLIYTTKGFFLRDMYSTNGTYVNGEPIDVYNLKSDDKIRIGLNVLLVYKQAQ